MRFVPVFTDSAFEDLEFFRKYEQTIILDQINEQLSDEPASETRHRKPLEPNDLAEWELRIGDYRVFYDVKPDDQTVKIKAVGHKEHSTLFIRGKEFTL